MRELTLIRARDSIHILSNREFRNRLTCPTSNDERDDYRSVFYKYAQHWIRCASLCRLCLETFITWQKFRRSFRSEAVLCTPHPAPSHKRGERISEPQQKMCSPWKPSCCVMEYKCSYPYGSPEGSSTNSDRTYASYCSINAVACVVHASMNDVRF